MSTLSPTEHVASSPAAAPATKADSLWDEAFRRFRRHRLAALGAVVLFAMVVAVVVGPAMYRVPINDIDFKAKLRGPSWAHPLGTDDLGRDVLSRVVWGTRVSMQAGVFAVLLAIAIGVPVGLAAGYYRGAVDQVIMRLTDAWLSFPFLILAIGLVTILGPSLTNATVAIGLGATPTYLRLTRGLVLSTKEEDFVQGARALGAGDPRLMARHILPNIWSALVVQATVSIPGAIIAEAILSFLGLGVQPPTPSWGTMLNTAQQFLESAPWMAWWPGLAIFSLALSFNLAGDGLRDLLDPRDY